MKSTGVLERISGFLRRENNIQRAVVGIAGAVCLTIALGGCASSPPDENPESSLYNVNTGYPLEVPYPREH